MGSQAPRTTSDPDKITVRSFKISQGKLERFARASARRERTVSQQMRWLIDRFVEEDEAERSEAAA